MKKKIYTLIATAFIFVMFYIAVSAFRDNTEVRTNIISVTSDTSSQQKDFTICIFNTSQYPDMPAQWRILSNLDKNRDSLHFNAVHQYADPPGDSLLYGEFLKLKTPQQIDSFKALMNGLNSYNLRGEFSVVNISNLCYAQRLEYEAEGGNDGFSYQNRSAPIEPDSGRMVIHACMNALNCPQADATPRWLCDSIYENMQHGDLPIAYSLGPNDTLDWHIKPVMRIDSSEFSPNDTRPVVAIVVRNFSNKTIDSVIIHVNNFRNSSDHYYGQYTDQYTFRLNVDSLMVKGEYYDSLKGLNFGQKNWWDYEANALNCKTDFKVYWFGLVDVWFDKTIVDDHTSNLIFNHAFDTLMVQEAQAFSPLLNNGTFFTDELLNSMVPCAKYINDKIKPYGGKLQFAISTVRNLYGTKNHNLNQKRHLEQIKPSTFTSDAHLILFGMPNNMPNYAGYSPALTLAQYNSELQKYLGDKNSRPSDIPQGTTVYQFDQARQQRDQYSPQTKIIMQPQIQAWINKYTNGTWFGHREPLNEEIEVQASVAIAHGADGISWFIMNSFISPPRTMP